MKKEITEYEPAEDTNTLIACGSCSERCDDRSASGINTVVLDAKIKKCHDGRYRNWRERDFDRHVYGDDRVKIIGQEVEDYCDSCWDGFFTEGHAAKVEESEYYVEEETREEYYCDLCGSGMGDEADHDVSVNPRIRLEPRIRAGKAKRAGDEREGRILTHDLDEAVTGDTSRDKIHVERDSVHDCCTECANEIFDLGLFTSSDDRSFISRLFGM